MFLHALIAVVYGFIFLAIIKKAGFFQIPGIPGLWVQLAFVLKIAAGLALWSVYTYHYTYRETSDSFRYFDDAMVLYQTLGKDPGIFFRFLIGWDLDDPALQVYFDQFRGWSSSYTYGLANDNPFVIRVNMIVALFSLGFYHVHTVFMSFLSLAGLIGIYRFLTKPANNNRILFILIFAFPSILFWTSGVLKEPLLICLLGIFLFHLQKAFQNSLHIIRIVCLIVLFTALLHIKPYVILCCIPAIVCYIFISITGSGKWISKMILVSGIGMAMLFGIGRLNSDYSAVYLLDKKRTDFYNVAEAYDAGSVIQIHRSENWMDLLVHSPVGLWNAYFRPHLLETKSVFYLAAALENALLLIFLILSIIYLIRSRSIAKLIPGLEAEFAFSLVFVLTLGVAIGSSVPVLGAIVRYQVPALPFLFFLFSPGIQLAKEIFQGRK